MGRLGKDNNPAWLISLAVVLALLAGCAGGARNGRYAGAVDADEGVCGPVSGGTHLVGSLQIRGDAVLFAPDGGVLILPGHVDGAGHVSASATMPGVDHKPFLMVFEGDLHGDQLEGHYATPRCRATVRLHLVS
jgi:hypothetical protein